VKRNKLMLPRTHLTRILLPTLLVSGTCFGSTLPPGSLSASWTTATASSTELWYRDELTLLTRTFALEDADSGEKLSDTSTNLKVNYGVFEWLEAFGALGAINKKHTLSDGSLYINNTELTYLTLGGKTSLPTFLDISNTAYLKLDYAFNAGEEYFFTSGNDRSHHVAVGLETSYFLPFGAYAFMDNNFKYRTQQAMQYEGTWGAGFAAGMFAFSGFYHYLWSQDSGFDCFHDVVDRQQFHYLPLYKANSTVAATQGAGWDTHHGPGASISMNIPQGDTGALTLEIFGYKKLAGLNTDKSTSIGANISYTFY
jgi:hypothetical protein